MSSAGDRLLAVRRFPKCLRGEYRWLAEEENKLDGDLGGSFVAGHRPVIFGGARLRKVGAVEQPDDD